MLTVAFRLSYAEHRRAMLALAGGTAAGRADVADVLPVFFAALGIASAIGAVASGAGPGGLLAALAMPIAFGMGFAWVVRKRPAVSYRFTDAGLVRAFGGWEREVAWSDVAAAEEREFFLFRAADEGWYLPRRTLGEAERARLRELMAAARGAPSGDEERERDDSR